MTTRPRDPVTGSTPPAAARHTTCGGVLAVAAFLCLTVLVFAPAQIYYGNVMDFPMSFREVLPSLVVAALLGTLLLTGALMALPSGRLRGVGLTLLLALGFLAWFQGNVLLWPYGVLDGRPIDWAAHRYHGLVDAVVWSLVLAGAFAFRSVSRIAATASMVFIVLQAGGIAIQAARSPDRWIDRTSFDDSARFSFSRDRNVVILVLDTFQSDLFQELLDEDPELAERFRGFTFFRNAVGGFPNTAASIPLILSGRYYDNAMPFQEFVQSTYRTASLPQALKAARFHVYYNNPYFWPSLYADERTASNTRKKTFEWHDRLPRQRAAQLMGLGVLRSLPQPGKRLLYESPAVAAPRLEVDGGDESSPASAPFGGVARPTASHQERAAGDAPFFRKFASQASVAMMTPTFKYYHVWGIHPPLTHDENLRPQTLPFTRQNAKRQAKGILHLLGTFLDTFIDRHIYDETLLFIVGDHGTSFHPRLVKVDDGIRTRPSAIPVATEHSFGLPLVLLKPIGAEGPMRVSDAPVSLSDIPQTVASALGLPAGFPGESMLTPSLPTDRQRRVLRYGPDAFRLTDPYFPPLTEYVVSGFSWLDESWRPTGREFLPGKTRSKVAESYQWGRSLRFGRLGDARPYLADGWAAPEDGLNWTDGRSARLRFTIPVPTRDVVFRARVIPALPGGLSRQRAALFVSDRQVGNWSVTSEGEYTAVIPSELAAGGELELVLTLPDAVAPRAVQHDLLDERVLALAMISAVLEEADLVAPRRIDGDASPIEVGRVIRLGSGSEGSRYLTEGWAAPEPGHTWTAGATAGLRFRTPVPRSDILFALSATPFVVKGRLDRQRVIVSIDGTQVGEWAIAGRAVYGVRIHKEQLLSPITEIKLELRDATVPKRLDPAAMDERQLALSVDSIMVGHDVPGRTPVYPTGATIVLATERPKQRRSPGPRQRQR